MKRYIGEALKPQRLRKRLSLRKLAELTEVSAAYLSQLETLKNNSPSIDIILSLSQNLDLPFAALLLASETESEYNVPLSEFNLDYITTSTLVAISNNYDEDEIEAFIDQFYVMKGQEEPDTSAPAYKTTREDIQKFIKHIDSIKLYEKVLLAEARYKKTFSALLSREHDEADSLSHLDSILHQLIITAKRSNYDITIENAINRTSMDIYSYFNQHSIENLFSNDHSLTYEDKELTIEQKEKILNVIKAIL